MTDFKGGGHKSGLHNIRAGNGSECIDGTHTDPPRQQLVEVQAKRAMLQRSEGPYCRCKEWAVAAPAAGDHGDPLDALQPRPQPLGLARLPEHSRHQGLAKLVDGELIEHPVLLLQPRPLHPLHTQPTFDLTKSPVA